VVAAVLAVAAAPAKAAVYCVHQPGTSCRLGTINKGANLQGALADASASAVSDGVIVGAGTYTGPFTYTGFSPVTITGAGDATVLRAANGNGVTVLTLTFNYKSTTVRKVRINVPTGNTSTINIGLRSSGTADGVNVVIPANATGDSLGVGMAGGTFRNGSVTGPQLGANPSFSVAGIGNSTTAPALIEDARFDLRTAIDAFGAATIRRVDAVGRTGFNLQSENPAGGVFVLEDSLWRTPPGATEGIGVLAACGSSSNLHLTARNLTVVNNATGNGFSTGVGVVCNVSGRTAAINLSSSIVQGGVRELFAAANDGPATIAVRYSDFDPAKIVLTGAAGAGVTSFAGNVNVAPGFVGAGDFRLAAGSPLIDAGDPAGLALGESATDLAGLPRIVDGLGGGTARRDIGAYERQPSPGSPGTPGGPGGGDVVAPVISRLRADPLRFRPAAAAASRLRRGTRFRFRLSETANVRLRLRRALPGRHVGRRCVKPTPRNRRARRCTRYKRVGTLTTSTLLTGGNAIRFSGRLRRHALKPSRYQVVASATDAAGNRSRAARAKFIVLPPR
jgi:hypothetical protein